MDPPGKDGGDPRSLLGPVVLEVRGDQQLPMRQPIVFAISFASLRMRCGVWNG